MNLLEALWGSPLIHRFGCGLLHFLWQGLLIAMIVAVALRILRGRSAGARYLTAWTALLVMALSVPITAWLISPPPVTEPAGAAVELRGAGLPADFAGSGRNRAVPDPADTGPCDGPHSSRTGSRGITGPGIERVP